MNKMAKRIKLILGLEWKYARLAFLWNVIDEFLSAVVSILVPFFMKTVIDCVMSPSNENLRKLLIHLILILGINLAQEIIYMVTVYYRQNYIFVQDIKYKESLYKKALKVSPENFESSDTYDIYSRAVEFDLETVHGIFCSIIHMFFSFGTIFSVAILMIGYSPIISAVFLVTYLPLFILKLKFQEKLGKFKVDSTIHRRKKKELFDFVHNREAVAELKLLGAFPFVIKRRDEITRKFKNDFIKLKADNSLKQAALGIIPEIVYFVSYAVYAVFVTVGSISYGDITFLVSAMSNYSRSLMEISIQFSTQKANLITIDQLIAFYELTEERAGLPEHSESFESLSLENVSFTYPGSEVEVLKNINLQVKRGEKVAIVGYNGSGKTTTAKLIMGLLDSYRGHYMLNGIDVHQMNHSDIYRMFSVGMQDYQKYPFSVRENITISDSGKNSEENLCRAVRLSGVDEIANNLPKGYDSILSKEYDNDGVDLSEGQWHKLILARAIYQSHDVVIFDEPTSSLDPMSEYQFVKNMKNHLADKTIIMITHRLSSVVDFDRIVVFANGRIIGDGSHSKLMNSCEIYREMYETQASRYAVV